MLHWLGDTFDVPPGAQRLARTEHDPNRAFRMGEETWGLLFHLEVTPEALRGFLDTFPADAARAPGRDAERREATVASLAVLILA